jgi:glycosyltransferase involved in cell wall biosynthesis
MKISVVMANYNRRNLLINTLKTIEYYNSERNIEVIVVDDASDENESVLDVPQLFKIPVIIVPITKKEKKWMCCCMPFNIGFSFVTGDIIIIQNPENLHVGDIAGYVPDHIANNVFLSFALYSLNQADTDSLQEKTIKKGIYDGQQIKKAIGTFVKDKKNWKDGDTCWYNHSIYQPAGNHLMSAITRTALEDLNGFDERYGPGFAYDDIEFKTRILRRNMIIKIVDEPFAIHQRHTLAAYLKNQNEFNRNSELLNTTSKENFYRAPGNNFYRPSDNKIKRSKICPVNGQECYRI